MPFDDIKPHLSLDVRSLAAEGRLTILTNTRVQCFNQEGAVLERVDEPGHTFQVAVDRVQVACGFLPDARLLQRSGVAVDPVVFAPQFDEATMETNIPGLYVAGTVAAGRQSSGYRLFIDNTHAHARRIAAHFCSRVSPVYNRT